MTHELSPMRALGWLGSSAAITLVLAVGCNTYPASLKDLGAGGRSGVGGSSGASAGGSAGSEAAGAGGASGGDGGADGAGASAGAAGDSAGGSDAGGTAGVAGTGAESGAAGDDGISGGGGTSGAAGSGLGGAGKGGAGGANAGTGGGGKGGTGGVSGSGGTGVTLGIDNFDDQDKQNMLPNGGYWYAFNDGTLPGTATNTVTVALPPTDPLNASTGALHLQGQGFTGFGAGAGVDFLNSTIVGTKIAYNISAYTAVRFRAKVTTGAQTGLTLAVTSVYSAPEGMLCTPPTACNDHFRTPTPIVLTNAWASYQVSIASLTQQGFGPAQPADWKTKAYALQFTQRTVPAPTVVDVWLDDVSLIQ